MYSPLNALIRIIFIVDDGNLDCKYDSSQKLILDRASKVMIYHLMFETTCNVLLQYIFILLYGLIMTIGIGGNIMVIFTVLR